MRVVLDACVLVPSAMRGMLIGAAGRGAFQPVWSARILEEWARAARKLPEGAEAIARAEAARLRMTWPEAEHVVSEEAVEAVALPDPDDRHVLALAIAAGAQTLLTLNRRDFPPRALARHGVLRRDPDGFLLDCAAKGCDLLKVAREVRAALGRDAAGLRPMLKRAGLPRLGKALAASGNAS